MSIVVCVPWIKAHKKHMPHFIQWYACNWEKHDLKLHMELWRPLHKVQANAVKTAREIGASHILFTEDYQWGYPVDGLDVLLEANRDVIGFSTYTKEPPHLPMTFKREDPNVSMLVRARNMLPTYVTQEIEAFDLITWAFTLVRTSVFDRVLEDPFRCWDDVPTDSHFCQACHDVGIPRYFHNGFVINHGHVPKGEIGFSRRAYDAMCASRGIFGRDAIVIPGDHDDYVYRPEFQQAIRCYDTGPIHDPDPTAEGVI